MTRTPSAIAALIVVVGVVVGATLGLPACGNSASPPADAPPPRPARVAPSPAAIGYTGVVAAAESVDLAPQISGQLRELVVGTGDVVKLGDVIATIDDKQMRDELAMATADLRAAQANVAAAAAGASATDRRLANEQTLYEQGFSGGGALDSVRSTANQQRAATASASALVGERQARLASLQRQIGATTLRAPFAGRVSVQFEKVGAMVGPGKPVVRIINPTILLVRFAVPSEEARLLNLGDAVRVDVDGATTPVGAVVQQISPELDPATGLVFCEARLDTVPRDGTITPRSAARVHRVAAGVRVIAAAAIANPPVPSDAGTSDAVPSDAGTSDAVPADASVAAVEVADASVAAIEVADAEPTSPSPAKPRTRSKRPIKADEPGFLAIGSSPATVIWLDGVSTNLRTPQQHLPVSAGSHRIALADLDGTIRFRLQVRIQPGRTTRVVRKREP